MSADGLAADSNSNIYALTGNGSYSLNTGGPDAGDSFIKLSTQNGLNLTDYFTPFNQLCLEESDGDLGSGGAFLLPDQTGTAHPHLIISAGKEGRIYVVDRDNMGHFTNDPNLGCGTSEEGKTNIDKVVQESPHITVGGLWAMPTYWSNGSSQWVYFGGNGDNIKAFQLNNDLLSTSPTSQSPDTFGFTGATAAVSSNGTSNGILWAISPSAALRAYDATNLTNELYTSDQNSTRDKLDSYTKFSTPVIANGEVFVGTLTSLNIFGLLNSTPPHQHHHHQHQDRLPSTLVAEQLATLLLIPTSVVDQHIHPPIALIPVPSPTLLHRPSIRPSAMATLPIPSPT